MTATRIRCGVAGTGSLGQHHARIYSTLPGAELAGIFEPNDARAAEICAKHDCRRFATLDEMAAGCDAVSVVVPTNHHAAVALPLLAKAMLAGDIPEGSLVRVKRAKDALAFEEIGRAHV